LFAVLPNDAGASKRMLVCMAPDGKVVWRSGKDSRFGLGPFLVADDKLFILSDDGELTMARATIDEYKKLATAKILHGREAWGPLAIANGRLVARDFERMVCFDMVSE
jgi:outer membrane protein assembly factor BamB